MCLYRKQTAKRNSNKLKQTNNMKFKITYTTGTPWDSKAITKTAISEGKTKDEALNNFYVSPEGKRWPKTILKNEKV